MIQAYLGNQVAKPSLCYNSLPPWYLGNRNVASDASPLSFFAYGVSLDNGPLLTQNIASQGSSPRDVCKYKSAVLEAENEANYSPYSEMISDKAWWTLWNIFVCSEKSKQQWVKPVRKVTAKKLEKLLLPILSDQSFWLTFSPSY